MTDTPALTCQLCRSAEGEGSVGIAWYRDGRGIQDINRCADHAACRRRVEAKGETWPLRTQGDHGQNNDLKGGS